MAGSKFEGFVVAAGTGASLMMRMAISLHPGIARAVMLSGALLPTKLRSSS